MSGEKPDGWRGAEPPTLSRLLGVLGEDLLVSRTFHAGSPRVVLTDRASYVSFPEAWLARLVEIVREKPARETPERPATDPPTVADLIAAVTRAPLLDPPPDGSVWQRNVPGRCPEHLRHADAECYACEAQARKMVRALVIGTAFYLETGETMVYYLVLDDAKEKGQAVRFLEPLSTWGERWFRVST